MLWGQRVRINAEDEVWCHFCHEFKTTAELSHPHNSCPVGLPPRGGIVTMTAEEMDADPGPLLPDPGDFMRMRW